MIKPHLPKPSFINRRDFGCSACKSAFNWDHFDTREIPAVFVPAARHFGEKLPQWTSSFYVCAECRAIWALSYNPRDLIYNETATPPGFEEALVPEPQLADLITPLFAWAPVDEMTERALWEVAYEPQELWDVLVAAWLHHDIDMNRKADILRQMARLLRPNNPHHRQLMQKRGWLLQETHDFEQHLDGLEQEMKSERQWRAFQPYAWENLEQCRNFLKRPGTVKGKTPPPGSTPPGAEGATSKRSSSTMPAKKAQTRPTGKSLQGRMAEPQSGAKASGKHISEHSLPGRLKSLLLPYRRFLPSILCGWLLVEWVGGNVADGNRWIAQAFFFCFVLVLNGVGAATNAGISAAGFGRIAWHRLSVVGDYLLFAILIIIPLLMYVAVASIFDRGLTHSLHWLAVPGSFVLLMIRFWPFWVIPYMQPVELDITSTRSPGIPKRSSLITAWKLTRERGTFVTRTLPWLLVVGSGLVITALFAWLFGATGRSLILYPFILPFLTAFTWALVEPMPDRQR